jgi:proteasome accessory factor C
MSASESVARMLTLVPWLRERPGASLAEIAAAFGVDEATVRGDLEALDFCGLPGLGGGALFDVTIVGDRVVVTMADELKRPLRPTATEALRLVLLVEAAEAVLGADVPELGTAVRKLRDALGVPEGVADVLEPDVPVVVDVLRTAARAGRVVRFDYQKRAAERPEAREVEPWAVRLLDGAWYLHGLDRSRGEGRAFRLDRASGVEVTDEPVREPIPARLDPPRYVPAADDVEAVLEVSGGGRWVLDAVEPDEVEDRADGTTVVRLRTDAPGWLARLVVMAGGSVRAVSPPELVDEVVRRAGAALGALEAGRPIDRGAGRDGATLAT